MHCPSCNHDNRAGRKFCAECGSPLALACVACGAPYEAGEKFCGECGAALGTSPPRQPAGSGQEPASTADTRAAADAGSRKMVTIVFADLVGSTALHERLDAESARRVMERYYEALRAAVEVHGGAVVKLLGDGVMAAFGLRNVAEDDALRAVRAGVAMQEAFRALVQVEDAALGAVGLRVAVNTGEVVVSGARDDVIGDPVNVAARLQEQGGDGDVVLGEATRRLVATRVTLAPLGSVTLKGRVEAVAAYRVVSLEPPADGVAAAPFVGREAELTRLEAVYDSAVTTPATRLAVLLGSPGLGKSRLIGELARRHADDATILAAHCDAAGSATFAPLAQVLRGFLGLDDGSSGDAVRAVVAAALPTGDEAERARIAGGIAGLLGGAATSPEETFFVVRRFLAGLAAARPVVLVIDDLHWAEPLLLDLVEHLVQWGTGLPLFVLIGARPELRDLRSSLVTPGSLVADVMTLGGLDAGAAMRLAANVIGAADLPAAVAAKVLATSEGNPLFVGELVRMLVQEGVLTKDGERWIVGANLAALEMPPTIHALLAARIERLRLEERIVLERAAVVGRHFSRSAVAALLSRNGGELDARLESLRRSELIERDTGWLLGEPVMRFHHVLIRDAAYRRLLKGTRAELHGRLADWIEGRVGDAPEHDEMIGWHLEQAHQHLRELGSLDAAGAALGERAARRLAAAGRRALARDDVSLAAGLCGRALDRLTPGAPERPDLVLDWCEALLAAGDVGPAADAIAELDRVAADAPRLRAWHTCFAGQLTVLTAPEALHVTSERVGAAARELAALGDAAGEAKAHFVHAQALARLGKVGACEAALDQALAAARRAGDRRRANAVLAGAPLAALWGPSPVTRASGRCLDVVRVLRITQGAPAVEAVALSCQSVLEALRGRTEAARRMLASSRTMVEELGISHRLFETDVFAGRIDLLEGDAVAAERALRSGYEGLRDLGLGIDAARAAALLGRALLAQDRAAEAETLSHESEMLAGDDLQAAIAWRGVRAEALARRGDHAAAITFAEAAVAIAAATDALLDHADARLALAAAFRAAGRHDEANAEEQRATDLWGAKGATVLAEGARQSRPAVAPRDAAYDDRVAPSRPVPRRVHPNVASELAARFASSFAAGDAEAIAALWSDALEVVDHANAASYGRDGHLTSIRRLRRARDPRMLFEPLATLGASCCLTRRRIASHGTGGGRFDVGESEHEVFVLFEVGASGSCQRIEIFGADHLGDALARLYERHAQTLPEGPARERAAVAARAVAFMLTPVDAPDPTQLYAPTYQDVDHRSVGYGMVSYDEARTKLRESFRELVDGLRYRVDDVLALDANGFVRKTTASGVWREGGGPFERTVCTFTIFGPDGRVTRHESFDPDREVEVLARFDALTADAAPALPVRRRVRPNAASGTFAALEAAFARRDLDAVDALLGDPLETIEHPTGTTYGREGQLESSRRTMRLPDLDFRIEPLATLGDALCLARRVVTGSGTAGGRFDVGEYEIESIVLNEVDAAGRLTSSEVFAADHLCQAIARLYERYAESLADGPERTRASGTARAHSVWDGPLDTEHVVGVIAPSYVCVDHRSLGTWSSQGYDQWLRHWRRQAELAAGFSRRDDDILAFAPAASVTRHTYYGTSRASGGYFENVMLAVNVFGADGLYTRCELFEPDQKAEALARYDALVGSAGDGTAPARAEPHFPNAATHALERFVRASAERDWQSLADRFAPSLRFDDRRPLLRMQLPKDSFLEQHRVLFDVPNGRWITTSIATRGERLVLARLLFQGDVEDGGGVLEIDHLSVLEVDDDGRMNGIVLYEPADLDAAYAELDARWWAGEEEAHPRVAAYQTAFDRGLASRDWDALVTLYAPTLVARDHRLVGWDTLRGATAFVGALRGMVDLAPDARVRVDHLRTSERGIIGDVAWVGTRDGGTFESPFIDVVELDADGKAARLDLYDPHHREAALARFDALVGSAGLERTSEVFRPTPFENPAAQSARRQGDLWSARDWSGLLQALPPEFRYVDRRPMAHLELDRGGYVEFIRQLGDMGSVRFDGEILATRGNRLALGRARVEVAGGDVGPSEVAFLDVVETDERGEPVARIRFDPDALGAAYAELDARYAAGEGARHAAFAAALRWKRAFAARDWDALAAVCAPDVVRTDHRPLGFGQSEDIGTEASGAARVVQLMRSLVELAPDAHMHVDHLRTSDRGALAQMAWRGAREGGAFEIPGIVVHEVDESGRIRRFDVYALDRSGDALARFEEIGRQR
ncbi:MAG TPA: nuclear transport factor 2 family protein [Candidatus Binatia bacterium]|jgi:class 3 adenylate cyclase/tetratricopeptide (TPR) repeat protein